MNMSYTHQNQSYTTVQGKTAFVSVFITIIIIKSKVFPYLMI